MGTGKTTVGRAVAQRIGHACIDSDREIEQRYGRTIPEIFATAGESEFRRMEKEFVESGHPSTRCVVACGGGLVVQPGMVPLLRSRGVVICLHASVATILDRTSRQGNRPLLDCADPAERIRTLYAQREPIYRSSGTVILTDERPLREVIAHVVRIWSRESAEYASAHGAA
jgi:shikimate kinase